MSKISPSLLASAGLIGGFAVTKAVHHRNTGGAVAGALGLCAVESCRRRSGLGRALTLALVYVAALGGSHPLAKKIGAWPSVLVVSGGTAAAAKALARKR